MPSAQPKSYRPLSPLGCLLALAAWLAVAGAGRAQESAAFSRGLNLNGPPVTIDGHAWEGKDSKQYQCADNAFENQDVPLVPATDPERAKMIRSSRWHVGVWKIAPAR